MTSLTVLDRAPEKPAWGAPCNGCGFCCAAEVCSLGKHLYGEGTPAPCPGMRFRDGRFWCGPLEEAGEYQPSLAFIMGIGVGCDSE